LNQTDKKFILNILSEVLQGNNEIAANKIKSFRILHDF